MRRILRAVVGVVVCVAAVGIGVPWSVARTGVQSRLNAGHRWMIDSTATFSPSGLYDLFLYPDGGMELDEIVHLPSEPPGSGTQFIAWKGPENINRNCLRRGYLAMQTNGNLVMYCRAGDPIWSTHTAGTGQDNHFQIQNDGNLVVRTATGRAVWSSGSTEPMIMTGQHLDPGRRLRTKQAGHRYISLTMQRTGDLVLTYGSRIAWHSGTHTAGSRLALLRGGNLVIEGPHGHTLWSTHTAGIGRGTTLAVCDDGAIAEARLVGPHEGTRWSRSG